MLRILASLAFAIYAPTLLLSAAETAAPPSKPNVVLILADDLGWSDLGCYGADLLETPRLDAFAQQSVRFTQAYAMSVCTPTRAMLMTGKHAARLGMTIWSEGSLNGPKNRKLLQANSLHDLPLDEITLAENFREAGWLTALVGKWHLGDADHFPESQGFDVNIGGTHWGAPQTFWWPYSGSGRFGDAYRYVPDLPYGKEGEYLTDRLTDEAIKFIDAAGNKPFFLYLAHHAPHTPIEAKPDDVKYFEAKLKPDDQHRNPVYAAMVKNLDDNVGRVLDHLERRGLKQETIVVFTSDNGGYTGTDRRAGQKMPVTNNAPLRSGKGSLYEGGIRVPLIVFMPGISPRSGGECREIVSLADLNPTLKSVLGRGLSEPSTHGVDGLDITSMIANPSTESSPRELYFHYPHYYETTTPASAVRAGDWKLIEYFEVQRRELFNLQNDPYEHTDLADTHPETVIELHAKLEKWRESVGAKLPMSNPEYDGKR